MPYYASYPLVRNLLGTKVSVLDFGCSDGAFLQKVGDEIAEGVGVDLDNTLIAKAVQRNRFNHVQYLHADAKAGLPFDAGRFDLIFAFGVLEHVGPEHPFMQEFARLLKPDGRLVIDVPSDGPFRGFDIGNIKYNYPRLHKWFYCYVARRRQYYEVTFGSEAPMFGQFSKEASEHRHYSATALSAVAEPWFEKESHVHYGLLFELIQFIEVIICKPFGRSSSKLFSWLLVQDCKIISPLGRANIVAVFRKKGRDSSSG